MYHILPNHTRSDATLFKFLEHYLGRLEGPLAVQVWTRFMQLVKELLLSSKDFKLYHFMALRSIHFFPMLISMIDIFYQMLGRPS